MMSGIKYIAKKHGFVIMVQTAENDFEVLCYAYHKWTRAFDSSHKTEVDSASFYGTERDWTIHFILVGISPISSVIL